MTLSSRPWRYARGRTKLVTVLAAFAIFAGFMAPREAHAQKKVQFGTLAPKQSIWGTVFQVWEKAVNKKSDGKLELIFHYNGSQGDEGAMVGKIKAGQLDGGAVTAVGLSKYYKPVLAMQMPGVLNTWGKVDKAIASVGGEFSDGLKKEGAYNLGWGFVGMAHIFSKGGAVASPTDLKKRKPYQWRDDIISPIFYQVVGATPVLLNVPEVLPNLKTGAIDVINSPALAVEALQWSGHVTHVSKEITGPGIGALIMNNSKLEDLPGDLRTIMKDTGAIAAKALTEKIKAEDTAAYDRMSKKMTVFELDKSYTGIFQKVRERLGQGTFKPELVQKIEAAGK